MEFIERLPLDKLTFLQRMTFKEYKTFENSKCKNDEERKKNYDKMLNLCNNFLKANGEIKRLYKYTGEKNWSENGEGTGRLFSVGCGIQGLPKNIRGFLLQDTTTDIDMNNCHPVILKYLCDKHSIECSQLTLYIERRDEILSKFSNRDEGKKAFLKATNNDKLNKKEKDPFFKLYDKEMKATQKILTKLTCYKSIVEDVPSNKLYNWYGSAINRILCFYENKILQVMINELNRIEIEICAPMFDGVLVYGNYYEDKDKAKQGAKQGEPWEPLEQAKHEQDDFKCCNNISLDGWDEDGCWCKNCDYTYKPGYFFHELKKKENKVQSKVNTKTKLPYENCNILQILEQKIEEVFNGLNMKLSFKEHSKLIQMPDDFSVEPKIKFEDVNTFEKVADVFETKHCKIINKSIFIKELPDEIVVMSKCNIKTSYEHLVFERLDDNKIRKIGFINEWLSENPSQRCYDDIGMYPNKSKCPKNIFNIWRDFEMEKVGTYDEKPEELKVILNHIKILCGNDENVYNYFILWIAQMIQFPEVKSICPTLISKEGAGKTTLILLLSQMLGTKKILQTTNPSRDVWGDFNGRMVNAFLVNLNEISKKDTLDSMGKIKGLITDDSLTINNKGVNQYEVKSFHRFITTTNNEEPINTTADDRRNLIIRSSDEKIGDKEYFKYIYGLLEDVNVVKTCYEFFKNLKGAEDFNKLPIPKTEHQNNLKELSKTPIEGWLENLTLKNLHLIKTEKEFVEMTGTEALKLFKEYCNVNEIDYQIDARKLGVRISNMKLKGISKGRHTEKGETKYYNIAELNERFKLFIDKETEGVNNEVEELEY